MVQSWIHPRAITQSPHQCPAVTSQMTSWVGLSDAVIVTPPRCDAVIVIVFHCAAVPFALPPHCADAVLMCNVMSRSRRAVERSDVW